MKGEERKPMKLISPSKIRYGNYLFPLKPSLYADSLNQLLILFSKRKFSPAAVCSVPAYWAPTINSYMKKIIEVDPKVEIGRIKEKNGRLSITIFTNVDKEKQLAVNDLVWSVKNVIDFAVCNRVNMCKVEDIDRKWLAIPTNPNATNAEQSLFYSI